MKKQVNSEPARPICSSCGKPEATHCVRVETKQLQLDREAGVRSAPYWSRWKGEATLIETLLCPVCFKSSVRITVSASASLESEHE